MINLHIEGGVRNVGKSQGYQGITVAYKKFPTGEAFVETAWELSPTERINLLAGGDLHLTILGTKQPPVALDVTTPDEELTGMFNQHLFRVAAVLHREDANAFESFAYLMGCPGDRLAQKLGLVK